MRITRRDPPVESIRVQVRLSGPPRRSRTGQMSIQCCRAEEPHVYVGTSHGAAALFEKYKHFTESLILAQDERWRRA